MKVFNNIDCVQIQIKQGQTEYYLPQNTNWKNRVIDTIVADFSNQLAPITLNPVLNKFNGQIYINLYDNDNKQIARNLAIEQINSKNNNPLYIGREISANLSYLSVSEDIARGLSGFVILLYIFYGTKEVEYSIIKQSVTIDLPLKPKEQITLQKVIENYIALQPANIKGVIAWGGYFYLTLRENNNRRTLNYIPASFMLPQQESLSVNDGYDIRRTDIFRLDNLNIDMYNSFVSSGIWDKKTNAKITFLY